MKLAIAIVWIIGCANERTLGPFVRTVRIEGVDLVLERCTVELSGDRATTGQCTYDRRRLPVTAAVADGIEPAQIDAAITPPLRAQVAECASLHDVIGPLTVRLRIHPTGRLITSEAQTGGQDLSDCVGGVLAAASFPITRMGGAATLTFNTDGRRSP